MYNLPYFKDKNPEEIIRFMQEHPFAMVIGVNTAGQPVATQIPVFMYVREGKIFLSGHIMRQTDHHKAFEANPEVLAVFTGAHTYVSATWYENPHQASTWNYYSVHARGRIRLGDEEELKQMLRRLTLHYEKGNTSSTTFYDNLPADYTERLSKGIVMFEIAVTELDHVAKLSQNRDEKSYEHIMRHLGQGDADAQRIAGWMAERKNDVFEA